MNNNKIVLNTAATNLIEWKLYTAKSTEGKNTIICETQCAQYENEKNQDTILSCCFSFRSVRIFFSAPCAWFISLGAFAKRIWLPLSTLSSIFSCVVRCRSETGMSAKIISVCVVDGGNERE